MTSRDSFLARFKDTAISGHALPSLEFAKIEAPLKELFSELLIKVGGQLGTSNKKQALQNFVDLQIEDGYQVLSLVNGIKGNRNPLEITSPHQLSDIDYTITPSSIAVAENGSVWIDEEQLITRNSVFICQHLIAVTSVNNIVGTLNEAIKKINKIAGNWGCFVSGPSKTADIEQALVIGAHGPMTMTVWLIE
jgi:L-lactate dehydrogenase complex protein LldG